MEALRDIHRAGVMHRDLKPANVLMAEDGPRVIDFGISRAAENHQTLTETGQMIGTPPFMSPEQFTEARTVGPASDVFSLGALLVYAVTGRGPFDADSPYLTAYRVVHDEPVLDGLAPPLRVVLERCLAKEAAERPQLDKLVQEFAEALPEPDPMDPDTTTLRLAGLRTVEETHGGADPATPTRGSRSSAPAGRARGRRVRPAAGGGRHGRRAEPGGVGVRAVRALGQLPGGECRPGLPMGGAPHRLAGLADDGARDSGAGRGHPLATDGGDPADVICQSQWPGSRPRHREGELLWETGAHADQPASGESIKSQVLLYGGALIVSTPDGTGFSLDPAHPERKSSSG